MQTVSPDPVDGADHGSSSGAASSPARRRLVRGVLAVVIVGFTVFWTWALFFASKEAVNRIEDRAWAARAEAICERATAARLELTDLTVIADGDPQLIARRADIVDESTDILEQMLDDIVAVPPTGEKGRAIVPMWEADYRTYLDDRRRFARQLRDSGENLPFYETADGIPISERIATFAGDNDMAECAPPFDLTR